ncbi:hypothetical protein FA95DRAFT_1559744 [Auriscalpium vulgare]|uniref:Uncharacterized protein n=1 Tax=Auriscalpium vulgare TaxID=40419 RepID=A0ACB8RSK3_9AGAM|nr:hypothetical protein FA95DRAFT_1559744 [Auriscalpium vulgare]
MPRPASGGCFPTMHLSATPACTSPRGRNLPEEAPPCPRPRPSPAKPSPSIYTRVRHLCFKRSFSPRRPAPGAYAANSIAAPDLTQIDMRHVFLVTVTPRG